MLVYQKLISYKELEFKLCLCDFKVQSHFSIIDWFIKLADGLT